ESGARCVLRSGFQVLGAGARYRRGVRNAELFEAIQVRLPLGLAVATKLVQIRPGIEPGVVSVIEHQPDRIVSYRLDLRDDDLVFAQLQGFLSRSVSADFR